MSDPTNRFPTDKPSGRIGGNDIAAVLCRPDGTFRQLDRDGSYKELSPGETQEQLAERLVNKGVDVMRMDGILDTHPPSRVSLLVAPAALSYVQAHQKIGIEGVGNLMLKRPLTGEEEFEIDWRVLHAVDRPMCVLGGQDAEGNDRHFMINTKSVSRIIEGSSFTEVVFKDSEGALPFITEPKEYFPSDFARVLAQRSHLQEFKGLNETAHLCLADVVDHDVTGPDTLTIAFRKGATKARAYKPLQFADPAATQHAAALLEGTQGRRPSSRNRPAGLLHIG